MVYAGAARVVESVNPTQELTKKTAQLSVLTLFASPNELSTTE